MQQNTVVGHIVRRRSLGNNLAFADIQVRNQDKIVKVAFRRQSPSWNKELDDSFPKKASSLPYGALVEMVVQEQEVERGTSLEVHQWKLLSDPKESALEAAKQVDGDGVLCSKYLKDRGEAFLKYNDPSKYSGEDRRFRTKKDMGDRLLSSSSDDAKRGDVDFSHGDKGAKNMRAKVFAKWLIEKFSAESLRANGGALDVAGGKGTLSVELALQGSISCTIIDPLVRRKLVPKLVKKLRKADAPSPEFLPTYFNQTSFLESHEMTIEKSSILIGLHPDECTEEILDVALKFNKSVAIVPCCVFPGLFPRLNKAGQSVRTYDQFLEYLLEKDNRLYLEKLPFEGRNQVIFMVASQSEPLC